MIERHCGVGSTFVAVTAASAKPTSARDKLSEHLREGDDGSLIPLTETGDFHLNHLRLNRSALLAHRCESRLLQAARQTQANLLERLAELDEQLQALSDHLQRIENETTEE